MFKKYGYAVLVFLPIIALFLCVLKIEEQRHLGCEVVVRLRGYDPRDLLSGHYISYRLDWDKTVCSQYENNVCPTLSFERWGKYYVPENKAVLLEKIIQNSDNEAAMLFSYQKGMKPLALKLLVNGEPWEVAVDKLQARSK